MRETEGLRDAEVQALGDRERGKEEREEEGEEDRNRDRRQGRVDSEKRQVTEKIQVCGEREVN